jgi:N-acyl-D-amino-acid deacylase
VLDILITGGEVYDGTGAAPVRADVGISGDQIVLLSASPDAASADAGPADPEPADRVIDATGKAVCPGFINILSHSYYSILTDPRSLGELTQGVTTEIFGEGSSMGPLTPEMADRERADGDDVRWLRLSEYLHYAENRGISQNIASFIGAGTLRAHAVGYLDRPATPAQLDLMRQLVAEEMAEGALGIGSSLIYPPGAYASTDELTAICAEAGKYGGRYASHIRNEGEGLLKATDEFIGICRNAGLPGEHWHLKAAGPAAWDLMGPAVERLRQARDEGLDITADVYPYTASSTGLTTIIPDKYHEGGAQALYDRLADPAIRAQIKAELEQTRRWGDVNSADSVLILHATKEENRQFQGRTLTDVAAEQGKHPIDAALELIGGDRSRIGVAFFSMDEENLRLALRQPWVSICSDGVSMAPEGDFLRAPTHPRAYGSFARVLGHYVRDEKVLTMPEAIRKMTSLPATTLGLAGRGRLAPGYFADVVIFDPATVADRATFAQPHQLSAGITEVIVNGRVTIAGGTFTGTLAGRALAGPGARR